MPVPVPEDASCYGSMGNSWNRLRSSSSAPAVLRPVFAGEPYDVVPLVPSVPRVVVDAPISKALAKLWALTGRPPSWAYVHAGDELVLDVRKSPFLKHACDVLGFQNLDSCLHLLDGREGAAAAFRPGARWDLALVNNSGMLRDEARIPAWWHLPANKGLVRDALGWWVVAEREHDDLPVPDDRLPLSELD
ncbi:phospholipase A1-Igamma2, chloroplastic-like [Setaria italica]|uniref:phospholipase A1-Igamma2, chloroplastic-like n=1 Tax=Setaria italica TaxID=4555 RepID=UPI00064751B0|nr:phospholipase A1-Igamma2, chloroplastic-like [Setaria italica]XP_034590516.1 phospholipase A1-Igamma2, chloroplastic-like [Setaria viridis]